MFRNALLVTEDLAELARWTEWLETAGFSTVACAGPRLRSYCPRQYGEPCVLRDAVDVAIVASRSTDHHLGHRDEPACLTTPDDGATIFVDHDELRSEVRGKMRSLGPVSKGSLVERAQFVCSRKRHPSRSSVPIPGSPQRPSAAG